VNKMILTFIVSVILLTSSCAYNENGNMPKTKSYPIFENKDEFNPDTIQYFTKPITILSGLGSPSISMRLYYNMDMKDPELSYYFIKILSIGDRPIRYSEVILLTGEDVSVNDNGNNNVNLEGTMFIAYATFLIDDETILKIGKSENDKIRLIADYKYDKKFSKKDITIFTQFAEFIRTKSDSIHINKNITDK